VDEVDYVMCNFCNVASILVNGSPKYKFSFERGYEKAIPTPFLFSGRAVFGKDLGLIGIPPST